VLDMIQEIWISDVALWTVLAYLAAIDRAFF
jgi:hypothetical protein